MITMSMLGLINSIFVNKKTATKFERVCWEGIRDRYFGIIQPLRRMKNFVGSFFIFFVLGILMFFIGKA